MYKRFVAFIPHPHPKISMSYNSKKQGIHIGGEKEVACSYQLGEVLSAPDQPLKGEQMCPQEKTWSVTIRNQALDKKQHPTLPNFQVKVPPKARNTGGSWQALQFHIRERSMVEAAERELGWASQPALRLQLPARDLGSRGTLLSPAASSPQLAAAPCWNPNFPGLENKASQKAVSRFWKRESNQAYLSLEHTF